MLITKLIYYNGAVFQTLILLRVDMTLILPSKPVPEIKPEKPVQPKPDIDAPTQPVDKWDKGIVYVEGNQTRFEGSLYKAKWWTRGDLPGDSAVWKLVKSAATGVPQWRTTNVYVAGDQVIYNGNLYEAKWWTRANVPSDSKQWKRQ